MGNWVRTIQFSSYCWHCCATFVICLQNILHAIDLLISLHNLLSLEVHCTWTNTQCDGQQAILSIKHQSFSPFFVYINFLVTILNKHEKEMHLSMVSRSIYLTLFQEVDTCNRLLWQNLWNKTHTYHTFTFICARTAPIRCFINACLLK